MKHVTELAKEYRTRMNKREQWVEAGSLVVLLLIAAWFTVH